MVLSTFKSNHLTPLNFKGLNHRPFDACWQPDGSLCPSSRRAQLEPSEKQGESTGDLYLSHRWKPEPEAYCIRVCPSVSECVSLCLPKTLSTPYLKNQDREFHPILVADANGLMCVLLSFWGQKVKGQGHNKQWPEKLVSTISQKTNERDFTQFGSQLYMGFIDMLISSWDQRVKGHQGHSRHNRRRVPSSFSLHFLYTLQLPWLRGRYVAGDFPKRPGVFTELGRKN